MYTVWWRIYFYLCQDFIFVVNNFFPGIPVTLGNEILCAEIFFFKKERKKDVKHTLYFTIIS